MKTLIVYYSFTNNNELLAKDLQEKLGAHCLKIEEVKKRTPFTILLDIIFNREAKIKNVTANLPNYDNVIFIAPVWAGKIATPIKSFIKKNRNTIKEYSFITVCGGVPKQKDKIAEKLETLIGHSAVIVQELWINDLLPKDQKNKIQYTTPYRINEDDLNFFEFKIDDFIDAVNHKNFKHVMAHQF